MALARLSSIFIATRENMPHQGRLFKNGTLCSNNNADVAVFMNSFKAMVQQKRVQILALTILLCFGIYHIKADVPNVSYFSSENYSICVASDDARDSAIAWIYPAEFEKIHTDSYFLPRIQSDFNTNFDRANKKWTMDGWVLSDGSSLDAIEDTRWEGFKILYSDGEFGHAKEVSTPIKKFPMSFSILAGKSVEILLCAGWNPEEYPSYYLNIGGDNGKSVVFKKIKSLGDLVGGVREEDITYKGDVNILSSKAWASFHLINDEHRLELFVVNTDVSGLLVSIEKKQPDLAPIYFLPRSRDGQALWKIDNNMYMHTNFPQSSKLGPPLEAPSTEVCVSLYVAMCDHCVMDFYILNGTERESIGTKAVENAYNRLQWREVRLLKQNNVEDHIQIFVETKFKTDTIRNLSDAFWAIDNIRVCTQNEIKVSTIRTESYNLDSEKISCQLLKFRRWRPPRREIAKNFTKGELNVEKLTTTSVSIKWVSGGQDDHLRLYNVKALGAMGCVNDYTDPNRNKSNSYIRTTGDEISITNLLPYTFYTMTVVDPIYNWNHTSSFVTKETEMPLEDELPKGVVILPGNVSVFISWKEVDCSAKYGRLLYQINITNKDGGFVGTYLGVRNEIKMTGLKCNKNYTIYFTTTRDEKYLSDNKNLTVTSVYNFTTLPGVAPKAVNFEAYAADLKSIDLRYELPLEANGIPTSVQVQYCPHRSNCRRNFSTITHCSLWDNKYCVRLQGLSSNVEYLINLSLKNNESDSYGKWSSTMKTTKLEVPGSPIDLHYEIVGCNLHENYCNLNITWKHPNKQISLIQEFDVTLTEYTHMDDFKILREIYRVDTYLPLYSHLVRYIPYSTTYEIKVQSVNTKGKSRGVVIEARTDDLGEHIDQAPHLIQIATTNVTFAIPVLDKRLHSYLMTVVVQDGSKQANPSEVFKEWDLCQNYGETWISNVIQVTDDEIYNVVIGNGETTDSPELNHTIVNKKLTPGETYCINFVITNRHQDTEHVVTYYERDVTTEGVQDTPVLKRSSGAHLLILLSAVICVVAGTVGACFAYRYMQRSNLRHYDGNDGEHIYMSLESLQNAVSNNTYDKLIPE